MKLPDKDDNKLSPQLIAALVSVFFVMLIILGIVIAGNAGKNQRSPQVTTQTHDSQTASQGASQSTVAASSSETVLHPQDLDIWDLYPEKVEEEEPIPEEPPKEEVPEIPEEPEVPDPSTDGRHTLVTLRDGTEEWVSIVQHLPKNDYDFTNLVCQNDQMKYFKDSRQISFLGVDVSKYNDYIDFVKVKRAGIDFVMIRAGVRGYSSGTILIDEYFSENLKRATDAGLEIGVYFTSQAITAEEVLEETTLILEGIADYEVRYPIAIYMGFAENDVARIEGLSKAEKTELTKLFLDTIREAGYNAMIYGDKEWLIKEIDMSKLTDYDVWLSQPGDLPDYPYQFTMWQYKLDGSVDGIQGFADLNISFIDYTEK